MILRRFSILVLFLMAALSAAAQGKYALIIGNDDYRGNDFKPMTCCVNDANAMARCMSELGYDTTVVRNATRSDIITALKNFQLKLQNKDDIAVFYYSGHAVAIEGVSFLVPAKTDISTKETTFLDECFNLETIKKGFKDNCNMSLLFIDACRDLLSANIYNFSANTFTDERKGASPLPTINDLNVAEQMVFFATEIGKSARPSSSGLSPFTRVLTAHIADEGNFNYIWNQRISPEVSRITKLKPDVNGTFSYEFSFSAQKEKPNQTQSVSEIYDKALALYNDGKYLEAYTLFMQNAEQGHPESQYMIGYFNYWGIIGNSQELQPNFSVKKCKF